GFSRVLCGHLRRLVAELHLRLAEVTAEQHLVARRGPAVGAALESEEPDVADVVLAAAVRAARDVDAHATDLRQAGVFQGVAHSRGETTRLRHRVVARIGPRAGANV